MQRGDSAAAASAAPELRLVAARAGGGGRDAGGAYVAAYGSNGVLVLRRLGAARCGGGGGPVRNVPWFAAGPDRDLVALRFAPAPTEHEDVAAAARAATRAAARPVGPPGVAAGCPWVGAAGGAQVSETQERTAAASGGVRDQAWLLCVGRDATVHVVPAGALLRAPPRRIGAVAGPTVNAATGGGAAASASFGGDIAQLPPFSTSNPSTSSPSQSVSRRGRRHHSVPALAIKGLARGVKGGGALLLGKPGSRRRSLLARVTTTSGSGSYPPPFCCCCVVLTTLGAAPVHAGGDLAPSSGDTHGGGAAARFPLPSLRPPPAARGSLLGALFAHMRNTRANTAVDACFRAKARRKGHRPDGAADDDAAVPPVEPTTAAAAGVLETPSVVDGVTDGTGAAGAASMFDVSVGTGVPPWPLDAVTTIRAAHLSRRRASLNAALAGGGKAACAAAYDAAARAKGPNKKARLGGEGHAAVDAVWWRTAPDGTASAAAANTAGDAGVVTGAGSVTTGAGAGTGTSTGVGAGVGGVSDYAVVASEGGLLSFVDLRAHAECVLLRLPLKARDFLRLPYISCYET